MDNSLADCLPFLALSDMQLISEYISEDADTLPMSAYENLTFDYFNESELHSMFSELDPDLCSPTDSGLVESNYYFVEDINNLVKNNEFGNVFMFQNINSMSENFSIYRESMLKNVIQSIHVLGFCETKLSDGTDSLCSLPGFDLFFNNNRSNSGGVALFVRESLYASRVEDLCIMNADIETIFIEFKLGSRKEIYGVVYRRPKGNFEEFISKMELILNRVKNTNCNIAGDFNLNLLNYENNTNVQDYVELMMCKRFYPCINRPTRVAKKSATIIDHIWTNQPHISRQNGILVHKESDHFCIFSLILKRIVDEYDEKEITYRDYNNVDHDVLNNALRDKFSNFAIQSDVNQSYNQFSNKIKSVINELCPIKVKKVKNVKTKSPWMTNEILSLIKAKNNMYKKYARKPITYGEQYRHMRNDLNCRIKVAKKRYYNQLLQESTGNSKQLWKILNGILNNKSNKATVIDSLIYDDNEIEEPKDIVNVLINHFVSVGERLVTNIPDENISHMTHMGDYCMHDFKFRPVTSEEVTKVIKDLKDSSAGFDSINIKIIKASTTVLSPIIKQIINQSFEEGIFPEELKTARLIPLFKSGNRKLPENYRPISILPSISKIIERIVYNQLFDHLTFCKILINEQFGFRPNRSPQKAILKLLDYIIKALDDNEACVGVFLDLSKAFDALDHSILLDKLEHYGVRTLELSWFRSYLYNRKQFVELNNMKSEEKIVKYGVPQGSTLGPLLFLLYVNDLVNVSKLLFFILFADDTNLLMSDKNINNLCIKLNVELKSVNSWLNANKLTKNMDKTHAVSFSRGNEDIDVNIVLDNQILPFKEETKFLGTRIDKNLKWKSHVTYVRNKVSKIIGVISKVKRLITTNAMRVLYHSLVLPYLQYCILAWGTATKNTINALNIIQKRLIRTMCHANPFDHTNDMFKNLKILKLNDIHKHETMKFIHNEIQNPVAFPFRFVGQIHEVNTRGRNNLRPPRFKSNLSKKFVTYNGCIIWNMIPLSTRNLTNKTTFKIKTKKDLLDLY